MFSFTIKRKKRGEGGKKNKEKYIPIEIVITMIESRHRLRAMILLRGNKKLSLNDGTCTRIFRDP